MDTLECWELLKGTFHAVDSRKVTAMLVLLQYPIASKMWLDEIQAFSKALPR